MKRLALVTVLICVALSGCSAVTSLEPVGEEPLVLVPEEWNGTWADSDDFLEIRVVDSEAGELEAAWIESDDEGFELQRVQVLLRQSGDTVFGNALELLDDDSDGDSESDSDSDDEKAESRYALFRLAREGGRLMIWDPKVEAFQALVESGQLPGTVTEGGDVVLENLSADQLELLSSDESAGLWDWKKPGVLTRQ